MLWVIVFLVVVAIAATLLGALAARALTFGAVPGARFLIAGRGRAEEALSSFQRIDDLIERMGAITRQLKSYARKGGEAVEPVDLLPRQRRQRAVVGLRGGGGLIHVSACLRMCLRGGLAARACGLVAPARARCHLLPTWEKHLFMTSWGMSPLSWMPLPASGSGTS